MHIHKNNDGTYTITAADGASTTVSAANLTATAAQFQIDHPDPGISTDEKDRIAEDLVTAQSFRKAFAEVLIDEFAVVAGRINAILTAVDNATSLADLKSRVALINDMPTRTVDQLKTALRNKL